MNNILVLQIFGFEILKGFILFIGITASSLFLLLAFYIFKNGRAWNANREALQMYNNCECSLSSMPYDYRSRIEPGLMVNRKTNAWVPVARLSNYAIYDLFSNEKD